MSEEVYNITNIQPSAPPRPTKEKEREADARIAYLTRFTQSQGLDVELRMGLNDVIQTLRSLRDTVHDQSIRAEADHEKMMEILKVLNKGKKKRLLARIGPRTGHAGIETTLPSWALAELYLSVSLRSLCG